VFILKRKMMRISLKIVAEKPNKESGRVFPRAICEEILLRINSNPEPVFIVNRVGLTDDVDMSRAVGMLVKGSAVIENSGELTSEVTFFSRQFSLAQPFDARKYPHVGTRDGGVGNAVAQLAESGGLKYMPCGKGRVNASKEVVDYELKYIYTEPI
jgi:hypothetical protein